MRNSLLLILTVLLVVGCGKTWDDQYEEWIKSPPPYGGEETLQKIRYAFKNKKQELNLGGNQITDLTPLAELTSLSELNVGENQITDLTPLAGLKNLSWLNLRNNKIADLTQLQGLKNLTSL